MSNLSTVHDAVREAVAEPRPTGQVETKMQPATFKVKDSTKLTAAQICENNGTSLSAFLRWCCILLVRDYGFDETKEVKEPALLPVGSRE